jgi:hypothetical protein
MAVNLKERYKALVLYHLFSIIHKNFIIKSKGGTDSLGNRWLPLSEKTRIYKPLSPSEKRKYRFKGRTKKEVLADRQPLILILTRRLERSLRPGQVLDDKYIPSPEQIARVDNGQVIVGSKVPYAGDISVKRPAIPTNINPWIAEAARKATNQIRREARN